MSLRSDFSTLSKLIPARFACLLSAAITGPKAFDQTGAFTAIDGAYTDPSCGNYSYTSSGGFFGRDLRLSMVAVSFTCYDLTFSAQLSR
jgi:hypothetical protein